MLIKTRNLDVPVSHNQRQWQSNIWKKQLTGKQMATDYYSIVVPSSLHVALQHISMQHETSCGV